MDPIDEVSRRRERYQRWAASSHPVLREIGEQLVRGQIRPGDLLTVPAYRELIQTGLTRIQREGDRIAEERAGARPATTDSGVVVDDVSHPIKQPGTRFSSEGVRQ